LVLSSQLGFSRLVLSPTQFVFSRWVDGRE